MPNIIPHIGNRVKVINILSDLPTPALGVITLEADTAYYFTTNINLQGNRLHALNNVSIEGFSIATTSITSSIPAGQALITSVGQIQITNIGLFAPTGGSKIFDLNGVAVANARCLFREITIASSALGDIKNYGAFLSFSSTYTDIKGSFTIDGTNGIVIFDTCQFVNLTPGVTSINFPSTYISTIRTRILSSGFNSAAGATSINVDVAITVNPESFVLNQVVFSGSGTPITGLDRTNSKVLFFDNTGIRNSLITAYYYMNSNATATVIPNTTDFVKIAGTTIPVTSQTQRFNLSVDNRALYTGAVIRTFNVDVVATMSDGNNTTLAMRIAKNGITLPESEMRFTTSGTGASQNIKIITLIDLTMNDYIEVFVRNTTAATNITVSDLSVIMGPSEI